MRTGGYGGPVGFLVKKYTCPVIFLGCPGRPGLVFVGPCNQTSQVQPSTSTSRAATSTITCKTTRLPTPSSDSPRPYQPQPKAMCPSATTKLQNTSPSTANPLVPASPRKTPTHDMPSCPPTDPAAPLSPCTPPARLKKPALALRRLKDFNAKGLLE